MREWTTTIPRERGYYWFFNPDFVSRPVPYCVTGEGEHAIGETLICDQVRLPGCPGQWSTDVGQFRAWGFYPVGRWTPMLPEEFPLAPAEETR